MREAIDRPQLTFSRIIAATIWNPFIAMSALTAGSTRPQQSRFAPFATLDPFPCRLDGDEILFQDHLHRRMGRHQLAQVTPVGLAPGALALIAIPVAQEEPFEPMPGAAPIVYRIGARTAQIADRFVRRFGNVNLLQFTGP